MYTTGYKRQFKELLENRALKIVTEKSKKRNPTHLPNQIKYVKIIILSQHTTVQNPQKCDRYALSKCSTSDSEG